MMRVVMTILCYMAFSISEGGSASSKTPKNYGSQTVMVATNDIPKGIWEGMTWSVKENKFVRWTRKD